MRNAKAVFLTRGHQCGTFDVQDYKYKTQKFST